MQDLLSIRAFHALYKHQSLTAAAKTLEQPKSTLSRRLTQLEEQVGHALMIRQGNRITITKAGEIFFDYCEQLLQLTEDNQNALQQLNHHLSGELFIVANNELIRGWLSILIDQFLEENPDISIRLISQYQANIDGVEPDLILWIGGLHAPHLRKEVLAHRYYGVYASPDYLDHHDPITHPRDLVTHAWIDSSAQSQNGIWLMHPHQAAFFIRTPTSRLKTDNTMIQLESLVKGRGVGLLPTSLVEGYSRSHPNQLCCCLPGWYAQPMEICSYTPMGRQPQKVVAFLQKVKASIPEEWLRSMK